MLAVSAAMSGAAHQQEGGGGEIDAAALDLLWGGEGGLLPPLSSSAEDAVGISAAANADALARGKRPAAPLSSEGSLLRGGDANDRSIADHLAYEYGTRAPGDTARPAPPPEEGDDGDDDENDNGGEGGDEFSNSRKAPRTSGPRRTTSGPSEGAARAKANRERARRERLNDFFAELVRAMAPCQGSTTGGGPSTSAAAAASLLRTDKTSVVADAIRLITALRAENGQLKQLNKFMEQRLASVERERAELMMRAAYAAGIASNGGGGGGHGGGGGGGGNAGGASGSAAAVALPPLSASDAAAAAAMLPPPWLPSSDLDTSLDGSKRPPAA